MRFRELTSRIYEEQGPMQVSNNQTTAMPTQTTNKVGKQAVHPDQQIGQDPVDQTNAPKKYADNSQLKAVIKSLETDAPNGKYVVQAPKGVKKIPHIRAQKISTAELKGVMTKLGAVAVAPDTTQSVLSGKFPVQSFLLNNIIYSVVIGAVKGAAGEESIGLNRKELAPTGLGLDGQTYNKVQLVTATKKAVETKIRDEGLRMALIGLVDIAVGGGKGTLSPELAQEISPLIGVISQDFGEILAPILLMDENDLAELPSGNNPIVDVKVKGMNLSVKALTGSGTSFRTVADLMDKYESSITGVETKQSKFNVLKQFHPSTGGKNVDKIIRAAAVANIPEYVTICGILGVQQLTGYSDLLSNVTTFTKGMDYGTFIKTFYPAMIAGDWGKPVGLPADGAFYMGTTKSKAPSKEKAAGKNSYDAKPGVGASDILTYVLGVGLLNYVRKGKDAADYSNMMTDIVKQADAVIGHIVINPDGSMSVNTKSFSDLKFEFQYHAPSHIPGNNLPGFMYVAS
jgi:hypothetical protein